MKSLMITSCLIFILACNYPVKNEQKAQSGKVSISKDYQKKVDELDNHYGQLYDFLTNCYDPAVGGFYEDTLNDGNPKIESSARAINMLERANHLDKLPIAEKEKMINYFQSMQNPTTGFFEDLQEKRDIYNRRGRAMGYSLSSLKKLNSAPKYELPNQETPGMEHLQSADSFVKWMENLDWNSLWKAGSKVVAQNSLIENLPEESRIVLLEKAFEWLAQKQNPETGWWGNDTPYRMLSGAFKLGGFYSRFDREMPNKEKIFASTLKVLEEEKCEDACWVRNPLHLLAVLYPDYAGINEKDRQTIIDISIKNILLFSRPDGGFARNIHQNKGVTDGCSQAMKTRDALRKLSGLSPKPFPNGNHFVVQ